MRYIRARPKNASVGRSDGYGRVQSHLQQQLRILEQHRPKHCALRPSRVTLAQELRVKILRHGACSPLQALSHVRTSFMCLIDHGLNGRLGCQIAQSAPNPTEPKLILSPSGMSFTTEPKTHPKPKRDEFCDPTPPKSTDAPETSGRFFCPMSTHSEPHAMPKTTVPASMPLNKTPYYYSHLIRLGLSPGQPPRRMGQGDGRRGGNHLSQKN